MIFIPTLPFKPQMWPALISLWSAENATWLLNPFEDYLINCLLNNNGKTQPQISSNLFFDVVLLRCQKLTPRDQLLKSRFRFASLDAYFVHKTVSRLFSSTFCSGIRVLRPLLHSTGNQESQCRKKEMLLRILRT